MANRPEITVGTVADAVQLRVPVDGRARLVRLTPEGALGLGHALANAAIDVLARPPGVPRVKSVRLKPFDVQAEALLEFTVDDGSPLTLVIDQNWLRALAAAAATALENAETAGRA